MRASKQNDPVKKTFLMTSIEFLASVPIVRSFLND